VLSATDDPRFPLRYFAASFMAESMPTNAGVNEVVGAALMRCLSDTNDPDAMGRGAWDLGVRRYEPEVCVPAILGCLDNAGTNWVLGIMALRGLHQYGGLAVTALPALTNAMNDPNPGVSTEASLAIQDITTETATHKPAP
jgi:hypothetical protein